MALELLIKEMACNIPLGFRSSLLCLTFKENCPDIEIPDPSIYLLN